MVQMQTNGRERRRSFKFDHSCSIPPPPPPNPTRCTRWFCLFKYIIFYETEYVIDDQARVLSYDYILYIIISLCRSAKNDVMTSHRNNNNLKEKRTLARGIL